MKIPQKWKTGPRVNFNHPPHLGEVSPVLGGGLDAVVAALDDMTGHPDDEDRGGPLQGRDLEDLVLHELVGLRDPVEVELRVIGLGRCPIEVVVSGHLLFDSLE